MTPHAQQLEEKIKLGQQKIVGKTILHTAPHHDDILLGYFPYALRNLAGNTNHVLYITSGANGVSDIYLAQYLSMSMQALNLLDAKTKQELKYRIREIESEKKWSRVAGDSVQIKNLRANFYEASALDLEQTIESDIQRIADYFETVQPDIITVLVDPVGIGPATHHRSQQVVMQAIARYNSPKPIEIIGYRNVWSSFSLEDTDMIVPVAQDELDQVESIFRDCFVSQTTTLILNEDDFDLHNLARRSLGAGGFAEQVTQIQKAQCQQVMQLLAQQKNDLKNYAGMIFLQINH